MENLGLNVISNLSAIVKKNQKCSSSLQSFLAKQIWTPSDRKNLLDTLSSLFIVKDCTTDIARHFRGLLLNIVENCATTAQDGTEYQQFCVALSKVVASHPDIKRFVARFLINKPSLLDYHEDGAEPVAKKSKKNKQSRNKPTELDLCHSCLRLLQSLKDTIVSLWDWSPVLQYTSHSNPAVRWYACHCVVLLTRMSDSQSTAFIHSRFNVNDLRMLSRDHSIHLNTEDDVYLLTNPVGQPATVEKVSHTMGAIVEEDLCDSVVSVCGILLHKLSTPSAGDELPDLLVSVPSSLRNLRSLALAVAEGRPVLLQGPVGSGKTSLVEHVGRLTGRYSTPQLMKVQLGDQTDSKALLGTYRCTDVPGEFVWQPGALTQAMTEGHWIILEDIDYAPMDVVSVLVPILESNSISLPGHGETIHAAPGFQLFATQRLLSGYGGWYRQQSSSSVLLEKMWTKINVEPLSRGELEQVIKTHFPSLSSVVEKLLDVYFLLSSGRHETNDDARSNDQDERVVKFLSHDGRLISTRDLIKWCGRIACDFNVCESATAAAVFQEALDCFCACVHDPVKRLAIAETVGAKLGVSKVKSEFYCAKYKPDVNFTPDTVMVGRSSTPRKFRQPSSTSRSREPSYAFTQPSTALLERVAVCVANQEPVLLVGETGTGKTSSVQYLANRAGHRLRVINMNQQSDSADLLGGYKPVELKFIVAPMKEAFELLFCQSFSRKQNIRFLSHVQDCFIKKRWTDLFELMSHTLRSALKKFDKDDEMHDKWVKLRGQLKHMKTQVKDAANVLAFSFIEGTLVKALKTGDWVLLDELNLASAETLECLSGLLESTAGSVVLTERGDTTPIVRHPNFRLFACMNPATDVGKKDLPPGIRNRFTEFFVDELDSETDLKILVNEYLKGLSLTASQVDGIVRFYLSIRDVAVKKLTDGTGHRPHYSLRTLCRALQYCSSNPCGSVPRSLYEGFCLSFLTQLDCASHPIVKQSICTNVIGKSNIKGLLKQPLPTPPGGKHLQFEGYWIPVGGHEPVVPEGYVLTPAVRANLHDLARVVAGGKHPVLLQGETSVGKTSLVTWLAKSSGNQCVRVNNHEHTDLQEYVGSYAADENGKLVFKEGVLVDAMRKGSWIILDELNLAPSDVLEALNRLLDDNRELFIPETQETVKAHPQFMLFATQNPPGQYGGRKVLSRAFRNRFVELHFDELPSGELETILHERCHLPMSYSKKLVAVMLELQTRRRSSGIFAGKQGFITLRDLFRWAERYHKAANSSTEKFHDWDQHIADQGYLLLAGRVRKSDECLVIKEVIEKHIKRKVSEENLFTRHSNTSPSSVAILDDVIVQSPVGFGHLVWTKSMQRLAVLVGQAVKYSEPVLLVGETGCGKTTICQVFAALANSKLYSVNCHLHTEGADFLGGLRPVRQRQTNEQTGQTKLFEWCDGPLVLAMKSSAMFLIDEISLADDSVLERLNSVLEPERTLLVSEKGGNVDKNDEIELVTAGDSFRIFATMNPGGDYGKKELSPALRNRFTEIWCPPAHNREDFIHIIEHNVAVGVELTPGQTSSGFGEAMMEFIEWFVCTEIGKRCTVSIRDILAWVHFINCCCTQPTVPLSAAVSYLHGACLVLIDGLGSGTTANLSQSLSSSARHICLEFLIGQLKARSCDVADMQLLIGQTQTPDILTTDDMFGVKPFCIRKGAKKNTSLIQYALQAPTTCVNAQRVLRGLQLPKPILLEGSPGVGKTSLVAAIAKASGNELVRINLSEQTDVSDLFGADLPVEGGAGGEFAWRDGPLLRALKEGHWIVLDELNLASQSVLEGLNACLDHRAEVFIPELGLTFHIQHERTRLFACQNPLIQGGGRRGLPRSFLNRFTQVFVEPLSESDLQFISRTMYPTIPVETLQQMITFNQRIHHETMAECLWGQRGAPWEFNLRDTFRWCDLMLAFQKTSEYFDPGEFVELIYRARFRCSSDKNKVLEVFNQVFPLSKPYRCSRRFTITTQMLQVGHSFLQRQETSSYRRDNDQSLQLLHSSLEPLELLMDCVKMNWMAILVGPQSSGKTSLVHVLSQLTNRPLQVMAMNSAMDTTELLGGFEQADQWRHLEELSASVRDLLEKCVRDVLMTHRGVSQDVGNNFGQWSRFSRKRDRDEIGVEEGDLLVERCSSLERLLVSLETFAKKYELGVADDLANLKVHLADIQRGVKDSRGGQFEWVDSPLVKALKNGHWLLIDNVNFCSVSVLDRLNALLEPNGVLTINERGVIDGKIPEIVPHPDFRLFLAMDPKHGEISRAMRNRGVEICVLGENEGAGYSDHDVRAMLHSVGIVGKTPCDTLTRLHHKLRECCSETYTVLDLLHVASLTVQQLQRGCHLLAAMWNACHDVYVRSQKSMSDKQDARCIVDKEFLGVDPDKWQSEFQLVEEALWPDGLPSVVELATNSSFAMMKRQSCLLLHVVNTIASAGLVRHSMPLTGKELFNSTAAFSSISASLNKALQSIRPAVRLLVESIPVASWEAVKDWLLWNLQTRYKPCQLAPSVVAEETNRYFMENLQAVITSIVEDVFQSKVGQELSLCLAKFLGDAVLNQPYDVRWNPQLLRHLVESRQVTLSVIDRCSFLANRLYLLSVLAEDRAVSYCNLERDATVAGNTLQMSPLQLSFAFHQGLLDQAQLPHLVLTHLKPLFTLLDRALLHLVTNSETMDDESVNKALEALAWKKRFLKFCRRKVEQKKELIPQLSLHWNWLHEKTLSMLFSDEIMPPDLCSVVNQLHSVLGSDSRLSKLHLSVCHYFGPPPPFKSEAISQMFSKLIDLNKSMGVNTSCLRLTADKVTKVKIACNKACQLFMKLLKSDSVEEDLLGELVTECEEFGLIHAETSTGESDSLAALLPVNDYFCLLVSFSALPCVIEARPVGNQFLQQYYESSCLMSPWKRCLFTLVTDTSYHERLRPFCSDVMMACFDSLRKSPAMTSPAQWTDVKIHSDLAYAGSVQRKTLSLYSPVLSFLLFHHLSPVDGVHGNRTHINMILDSFETKKKQLQAISGKLWACVAPLHSNDLDIREINRQSLKSSFFKLVHSIAGALQTEALPVLETLTGDVAVGVISHIKQHKLFPEQNVALLESCYRSVVTDLPKFDQSELKCLAVIGRAWALVGLLQMALLAPQGPVDPAYKHAVKLNFMKEEIADIETEMSVRDWQCHLLTGKPLDFTGRDVHPRIKHQLVNKIHLQDCVTELEARTAVRPVPSQFSEILQATHQFMATMGGYEQIMSVISNFDHIWSCISRGDVNKVGGFTSQVTIMLRNHEQFLNQMSEDFPLYRDVLVPFLAGLSQLMHGLSTLCHVTEKAALRQTMNPGSSLSEPFYPQVILETLIRFPNLCESCPNLLSLCHQLVNSQLPTFLARLRTQVECKARSESQIQSRLLDIALMNIRNHIVTSKRLDEHSLFVFSLVLHKYVASWQDREEARRQKEMAETSLYHYTSHGDARSEQEREEAELRATFPQFESDFDDIIKGFQLDDVPQKTAHTITETEETPVVISDNQMSLVSEMHQQIFPLLTRAPWLGHQAVNLTLDFASPVRNSHEVSALLTGDLLDSLDWSLDKKSAGSHLVVSALLQQDVRVGSDVVADTVTSKSHKPYDFYHDANVAEAVQCRSVLTNLIGRVEELLSEWPNHPTLQMIVKIQQRLVSFPVTSPLMKMVTGMELLQQTCQEWESNAARHVSLQSHMEAVTHIIIQWRKLELKCWRSCLDMVEWRVREKASRWWFHLYQLLQAYLTPEQNESASHTDITELIKSFQQFLESSTIGEFELRLEFVFAFHCQLINMDESAERNQVMAALWNVHSFYKPFLSNVTAKLRQLRTPIEKELKGFVKIARWNDINFWAMKAAADKAHRTLHKHVRQYEGVLTQPVRTLLTEAQNLDVPSQESTSTVNLDCSLFLTDKQKCDVCLLPSAVSDQSVLRRSSTVLAKMKKLCQKVFQKAAFPELTEGLDEFTGDIIENVHELQALDFSKDADKDKRKSEAKHIDLRKRKALSDLFKYLAQIGLSYRKGNRILKDRENSSHLMLLLPVNITALTKQLSIRSGDTALQSLWSDCNKYFSRTLARQALFHSSLETPSKELGTSNLERCKGFAEHLVHYVEEQRSYISRMVNSYYVLRKHFQTFERVRCGKTSSEASLDYVPDQKQLKHWTTTCKDLADNTSVCLQQYRVLMDSCPGPSDEDSPSLPFPTHLMSPVSSLSANSEQWTVIVDELKILQDTAAEVRDSVLSHESDIYTWNYVDLLSSVFQKLNNLSSKLVEIAKHFSSPGILTVNCFNESLVFMGSEIEKKYHQYTDWTKGLKRSFEMTEASPCLKVEEFTTKMEELVTTILVGVQNVFKSQCSSDEGAEDDSGLLTNHLSEHLTKSLYQDCDGLNLSKVATGITELLSDIVTLQGEKSTSDESVAQCCHLVLAQLPLYDQYLHLVQYYVVQLLESHRATCKLAAVLLGIFSELTLKGFCLPAELSDEMDGEGATQFEDIEGGGLGEGQGAKDVSDQIENEDQLDEAQKAGEEKQSEDHSDEPDIKSEDNAIEMSDDFDGKLQDLEATEGDNSESEGEDEPQLDKQMGEVDGQNSDKLDEQIWGGDESEEETEEDKKEEQGPGAAGEAESEMVAKDENEDKGEGKKTEEGKEKEQEIGEEKINEMKPPEDETEYDDDKIDPHYGQQDVEQEPEVMDVPDDLKLDDEEADDRDRNADDNEVPDMAQEPEIKMEDDNLEEVNDNLAEEQEKDVGEGNGEEEEMSQQMAPEGEDGGDEGTEEQETEVAMETDQDENEGDGDQGINSPEEPHASDTTKHEEQAESEEKVQSGEQYGKTQQETTSPEQSDTAQDSATGCDEQEQTTEGTGLAESEMATGQNSETTSVVRGGSSSRDRQSSQSKPGKSDDDRIVGNVDETVNKKLQTIEPSSTNSGPEPSTKDETSDVYEHIKKPDETYDAQTIDAATAEQHETRHIPYMEEGEEPENKEDMDIRPNDDEEVKDTDKEPAHVSNSRPANPTQPSEPGDGDKGGEEDVQMVVDGERVATSMVQRSALSSIHTQMESLNVLEPSHLDIDKLRSDLENQLTTWCHPHQLTPQETQEAESTWHKYEAVTLGLSQELCEQLRLVLEPSQATKLKGDYRTGKRLNMRKVIPYIASQFRKDKIWLRRTKPSKRQYQIMVAVDDSSSMADNHSKQLAFESLAVIANALTLLEAGELSICSFGEHVQLLHPFSEPFTGQSGAKVLHQFTFEQKKTKIALLLQEAIKLMLEAKSRQTGTSSVQTSQLLLIVSDGRGLFLEGMDTVRSAVRMAREANVFLVFVIIDNPESKDSILDIRVPVFKHAGQMPEITSYMEHFPFPFYIILRNINSLPQTLSDALRQWFELVTAGD